MTADMAGCTPVTTGRFGGSKLLHQVTNIHSSGHAPPSPTTLRESLGTILQQTDIASFSKVSPFSLQLRNKNF